MLVLKLIFFTFIYTESLCISFDDIKNYKNECITLIETEENDDENGALLKVNDESGGLFIKKLLNSSVLMLQEDIYPSSKTMCKQQKCILEKINFQSFASSLEKLKENFDESDDKNKLVLKCFEKFSSGFVISIDNVEEQRIKEGKESLINVNEEERNVNFASYDYFEGLSIQLDSDTVLSNEEFCDTSLKLFKCLDEIQ